LGGGQISPKPPQTKDLELNISQITPCIPGPGWYNVSMKDNEIMGDAMDEYRAHQEQEAQEASSPLPKGWENAPLSAQVAWLVHGQYGEHDEFDSLKAELKGEI